MSTDVATVSLADLDSVEVRRDPYPWYARMHDHGPVAKVAKPSRFDFVISGFAAANQLLRDPTIRVVDVTRMATTPTWEEHPTQSIFMNSVVFTNNERHMKMRKMFTTVFTPRRVAALEPAVSRIVSDRLERMARIAAAGEPVEFMSEFCYPVPSDVLGELLGVPEADRAWYRPLAATLGVVLELGGSTTENTRIADEASRQLLAYFDKLCDARRDDPRDDLVTALAQAMDEGTSRVSPEELLANLVVLFNAGFVTTTHLIGNGLTLLLDHPEAMAALRADPKLAPAYIEEMLRLEGPIHFMIRWSSADTEVAGVSIPAGSRILVLLAAGNRDPARFPDPDTFNPSRTDNQILSFGLGAHFCLGAALARLEGDRAFNMLLDRFPTITLDRPPGTPG
ncbi:MAG TPA: cytochrome P450, partial [Micromonosporaceae bacterium]|nr:cytochrome P450 [Micromonosporaceae bacterium]